MTFNMYWMGKTLAVALISVNFLHKFNILYTCLLTSIHTYAPTRTPILTHTHTLTSALTRIHADTHVRKTLFHWTESWLFTPFWQSNSELGRSFTSFSCHGCRKKIVSKFLHRWASNTKVVFPYSEKLNPLWQKLAVSRSKTGSIRNCRKANRAIIRYIRAILIWYQTNNSCSYSSPFPFARFASAQIRMGMILL